MLRACHTVNTPKTIAQRKYGQQRENRRNLDFDACLLWDLFIEGEVDEATPVFVAAMVLQRLARAHVRSCGQSGTDTALYDCTYLRISVEIQHAKQT